MMANTASAMVSKEQRAMRMPAMVESVGYLRVISMSEKVVRRAVCPVTVVR